MPPEPDRVLVIGCGAMARELLAVVERNQLTAVEVECLPATYHNTPALIPPAVDERIRRAKDDYRHIFVAYGDCGTGGRLDRVLETHGVQRLAGAHCYEFLAGAARFAAMHDAEPTTFYLTDFLVRNFDLLVWRGLGLDRWPQLLEDYFGNYTRVVYLSQIENPDLVEAARRAAQRLGLEFIHQPVGYGELEPAVIRQAATA